MAKKINETKKKEEIENTIDTKKIKKDLEKYFEEKKEEFTTCILDKVDEQIELKVAKRLKEEEKKFVRGKTGKIIRRDILILLLVAIIGYFSYCLYQVDYFHIRTKVVDSLKEPDNQDNQNSQDNSQDTTESVLHDNAYYIHEYRYLVDQLQIDDEAVFNLYQKKLTREDLPNELLLKVAYKNLKKEQISEKENMITFKENDLFLSASQIFGNDVVLKNQIFTYNHIRFMYYDDTYLGFMEECQNVGLLYDIADAKMEEDKLIFDVVVGRLEDKKLFDNKDKVVVENYQDEDLLKYKDKLSIYRFTFLKEDDHYIFSCIESI